MNKKNVCCCPLLMEGNWISDYEISVENFAAEISFARSFVKDEMVRQDLEKIIKVAYDLIPIPRKKTQGVIEESYDVLDKIYDKYETNFDKFYLPLGDSAATAVTKLISQSKMIIRLLNKNNFVEEKLFDCFNILGNIFHFIWLKLSNEKVEYNSKSYLIKGQCD